MPDEPTPRPDSPKDDPKPDPPKPADDLGDNGKKALNTERQARRDAEQKVADLQKRLDELDDKDKSEVQKLTDRLTAAEKRAGEAEARVMRAEVAAAKGLTPAQAKRLVGATQEELEADAEEILEAFGSKSKDDGPPSPRPRPTLRGGSDPTEEAEEMDPRKLAAQIPRP